VNRNPHVVLGGQLLQAGEGLGIRLRIGRDAANAQLLRKLEDALVGGVIPRKTIDALSADGQARPGGQIAGLGNLLVARGRGQVSAGRELNIAHAHALQVSHHLRQCVLTKRDRLYANGKAAPLVGPLSSRRSIRPI